MMQGLILASQSGTRAKMLSQAGISFTVKRPEIDEAIIKEALKDGSVEACVEELASAKARAVSAFYPDDFVLGCDQVLDFGGKIFDKPRNFDEAKEQLEQLRGKKHSLFSALVVMTRSTVICLKDLQKADLTMRDFSDRFLDQYMKLLGEEIFETVGGYKIENIGIQLFKEIRGDHTTILGLPLYKLMGFLREQNILID